MRRVRVDDVRLKQTDPPPSVPVSALGPCKIKEYKDTNSSWCLYIQRVSSEPGSDMRLHQYSDT